MKKLLSIIALSILGLVLVVGLTAKWYVETVFEDVINSNSQRAYDVTYESLVLHTFLKGITLKSARIEPLHVSDTASTIHGSVELIELEGVVWRDLIFSKEISISDMVFINPDFDVYLVERDSHHQKKSKSTKGFQQLFGDILSRGEVQSFRLEKGYAEAKHKSDSTLVLIIKDFNLEASEIETDSIQAQSMIPFKVGRFQSSLDSAYLRINPYTELRTGYFEYQAENSELEMNNLSLAFTDDPIKVSQLVGEQTDLIEVEVQQLKFHQLDAMSNLYTDLDIRASSMLIDGLVLKDFRDKNKNRPPDQEKVMFKGMVDNIPVPLKVDSIVLRRSHIYYSELGEEKDQAGTVHFADINGSILNVTSIPEFQQEYQGMNAHLKLSLNQVAPMELKLEVPYDREVFNLQASIGSFDPKILNQTIIPMADVEVTSGNILGLHLTMNAENETSANRLVIDYDDLGLAVLKDKHHELHKRGLVSAIANSMIRKVNLPEEKHYQVAEYESYRNIYRGPFNYMWQTTKEGLLFILPTRATGILIGDIEKKTRKKQRKQQKRQSL